MEINLTHSEIKKLWVLCMSELSDDNKELTAKLTKALKESAGGSK